SFCGQTCAAGCLAIPARDIGTHGARRWHTPSTRGPRLPPTDRQSRTAASSIDAPDCRSPHVERSLPLSLNPTGQSFGRLYRRKHIAPNPRLKEGEESYPLLSRGIPSLGTHPRFADRVTAYCGFRVKTLAIR